MKNFYILSFLIILNSCNIKEAFESLDLARESETLAEIIPEDTEDNWQFLGIYTGEKEEQYNQKLSYELYLWQLDNKFKGYIYYLWYVTDFNYNEYQSLIEGKPNNKNIVFKGSFGKEPVIITIHDSIMSEIKVSFRYPTNSSASVNQVPFVLDKENRSKLPTHMDGEITMKKTLDSLMSFEMKHRGY